MALGLALLILPAFNNITQKHLSIFHGNDGTVLIFITAFTILIGLLAGLYPAFYLSGFRPAFVLKGSQGAGKNTVSLRKVLVVLQFVISVVLIVGSIIISNQMNYMQSAKLGFDKEQVLVINNVRGPNAESFQQALTEIPGVKKIANANGMVGGQNWTTNLRARGSQNGQLVNFLSVGYDYMNVMGISIKEGRGFSKQFPADSLTNGVPGPTDQSIGSIILNETAVKDLGIASPVVGKQLVWSTDADTTYYVNIIGVAKDFHFTSLRDKIKPFAFIVANPQRSDLLAMKLGGKETQAALTQIQSKWKSNFPERPFDYYFLDDSITKLYKSEQNFKNLFSYFTIIALIIACLGLFGLATFTAEQRTKEIGVRKVLGATVANIVAMLSKDFLKLVAIAAVIAFPIAWFIMNKWLQDFSYRVNINWWVFVVSGIAAVVIALLTISFQAIKAGIANPVKSLRTE
jgi:putative ABC transport system permease protein